MTNLTTDAQLIERFVATRSQEAFAEIVSRHLGWVTAAARRRLGDPALADDAAQGVFVLLAQKASSLRRETVLSAWLFTSLRYVCLSMIREEARRKRREMEASAMRDGNGEVDPVWEELKDRVDDVVGKLGGTDRRAVLLRFYENKTFGEVGDVLGISEEAARKRVGRAVEKLSAMFRRLGVEVPASAMGVAMLAHVSGAAGATNMSATVAGAALAASSSAPALVKSAASMIAMAQAKAAALIVAASVAAVAAGSAGVVISRASSSTKPQAAVFAAPVTPAPVATTAPAPATAPSSVGTFAAGEIFAPDDKPVAGARLVLVGGDYDGAWTSLASGASDANGRFRIDVPAHAQAGSVMVDAPPYAYGVGYVTDDPHQAVVLTEARSAVVQLLMPDGSPAAGIDVAPMQCNGQDMIGQNFWSVEFPEAERIKLVQKTDAKGICRFERIPGRTNLWLDVRDERFAKLNYLEGVPMGKEAVTTGKPITLQHAATIAGKVIGLDGKPVAGVRLMASAMDNSGGWGIAVTDASGAYVITRLRGGIYGVALTPKADDVRATMREWTASARENIAIKAGQKLGGVDFQLERGTVVRGKVTLRDTGAPVADFEVSLLGTSEVQYKGAEDTRTSADGTFAFRVPAGKQHLVIGGEVPDGYSTDGVRDRDVTTAVGKETTVNFALPRAKGKAIAGVVKMLDGSPAAGAYITLTARDEAGWMQNQRGMRVDNEGKFAFKSAAPGSRLRVTLGRLETEEPLDVKGGETNLSLVVQRVTPITLKGRVVDPQGNAIRDASVSLRAYEGNSSMVCVSATSDAEGNYSIEGLRLGTRVELTAQAKRFGHKDANVTLTRGKLVVDQPTLVLKPANSVVTGSVLDTSGRPMAGIEVSLYGEQTAWQQIKTNDAGEFEAADIVDGEKISVQVKVGNTYINGGEVTAGTIGATITAKPYR